MDFEEYIRELEKHNILECIFDDDKLGFIEKQFVVKENKVYYWVYSAKTDKSFQFETVGAAVNYYLTGELIVDK